MQAPPCSDAPVGFVHGGAFQSGAMMSTGGLASGTPYAMVPMGHGLCNDPVSSVAPYPQTCFVMSADGASLVGGPYQYSQQSYQMQPTMVATMPSMAATSVYAGCTTAPCPCGGASPGSLATGNMQTNGYVAAGLPMHAAAACPGASYSASCQPSRCPGVGLPFLGAHQAQPSVHAGIATTDGVAAAGAVSNAAHVRTTYSQHRGPDLLQSSEGHGPKSAVVARAIDSGIVSPLPTSLPSQGSAGHARGSCRPCAFFHTPGCANGVSCPFCHLCDAGERKRRKKEQQQCKKTAIKFRASRRIGPQDAQRSCT